MIKMVQICCVTLYIAIVSQLFLASKGADSIAPSFLAETSIVSGSGDSSTQLSQSGTDLRLDMFCGELPLDYCQMGLALLSDACPVSDSIAIKISTTIKSSWIPIQMYCDSPNPGIFYFDHNCEPWEWTVYRYRDGKLLQESTGVVNP